MQPTGPSDFSSLRGAKVKNENNHPLPRRVSMPAGQPSFSGLFGGELFGLGVVRTAKGDNLVIVLFWE